jgi:RNA polymerase sigma-70 factor (ECF subfamily)
VRGESREQLAARFGRPVGTIKTWLRRALLQIKISQKAVAE